MLLTEPRPGARGVEQGRTAVVAALRQELEPLLGRVRVERRCRAGGRRFLYGTIGATPVVLTWTGEGRRNVEAGLASLMDHGPLSRLLVVGVAGALSPALQAGSLIAGEELRLGSEVLRSDAAWLCQACRVDRVQAGTILTVDEIVVDIGRKEILWRQMGAPQGAVVDMESAYVAQAARTCGLPVLIVRAVSDRADEALPDFLNRCRDPQGGISRYKVLAHALLRPDTWAGLIRLRLRVKACAESLALCVIDVLG